MFHVEHILSLISKELTFIRNFWTMNKTTVSALQEQLQDPLEVTLPSPFQFKDLGVVGFLSVANVGIIVLLGGIMMMLSSRLEFFIMTLAMAGSAGAVILLLLARLRKLGTSQQKQGVESKAYERAPTPFMILTSDLHFSHKNTAAVRDCWWAENLTFLKSLSLTKENQAALERLMNAVKHQQGRVETLFFRGKKGEEAWRIQTSPFSDHQALWQCMDVTEERHQCADSRSHVKLLDTFLDHAPEGLFSLNENGALLFCNEKFASWLGYSREKLVGVSLTNLLVKTRGHAPADVLDIQGKCDFLSASSRVKSAFLEQDLIQTPYGNITYSRVNAYTSFSSFTDLKRILEMSPLPIVFLDGAGTIQDANLPFRQKFWFEDQPAHGASFFDRVMESQTEEVQAAFQRYFEGRGDGNPIEVHLNDKKGSILSAYIASMPVKNTVGLFIQFHDITEQKRFENQLVQSQKMQAVGQLAGGIAHDFNNLLTAMLGFCDMILMRHTPGDQSFIDIMQIKQNATRAANLVRQLLAFSRRQPLEPMVLNITDTLAELSALLRRLLGANVDLKIKYARDLGLVLVDKGYFEQVIINMMVNARDAMPGGGTITLTMQNYDLKEPQENDSDIIPAGPYVLMQITDTGEGINPEDIDHIFDPFFSTKEVGSGTGLGLSTVYGIVKQAGGFIQVESVVGAGTTFSIYLPHCSPEEALKAALPKAEKPQLQDLTGSSTILLVEDEDAVRLFSARALRSKGYKVIEAMNGEAALEYMQSNAEPIDLVISDVIMPNMDGPTFINEMNKFKKNQKVLFISGYTEDTFYNRIKNEKQIQFLPKPFSLVELATRVKEILNESSLPGA